MDKSAWTSNLLSGLPPVLPDSNYKLCGQGLMVKMTFRRAKCLAKVVHTMETGVLNIPTPVSMTPCPPTPLLSLCCVFSSIISGTQFGAGLPRSAHAQAQSDSTVRHQTGHAQNEEALHQTESQILCYWKTQQKEWSEWVFWSLLFSENFRFEGF